MPSPNLLQAIADPAGGRVVIVAGAGCSVEDPTNLPMAWECSREAHQRLIDDQVLCVGDCDNPDDLSRLADAVTSKRGNQIDLVNRLPIDRFKAATPNKGHLLAIALMVEGAISHVVTLNFDLAFTNALSHLNASGIRSIRGPENHNDFCSHNIVYLHRCADANPEQWVLTTKALNNAWQGKWEQIVARLAATFPITVFAGVGSSCGVLTDSVKRIFAALGYQKEFVVVDPRDPNQSTFVAETCIAHDKCEQLGWVDFMTALGERFKRHIVSEVERVISLSWKAIAWQDSNGSLFAQRADLSAKLADFDLMELATIRARWALAADAYCKTDQTEFRLIADALMSIDVVERLGNVGSAISENACISFALPNNRQADVLFVSGVRGLRWSEVEQLLGKRLKYSREPKYSQSSRKVIAASMQGPKLNQLSAPQSIIESPDPDDIISGGEGFKYFDLDELRQSPNLVTELLA